MYGGLHDAGGARRVGPARPAGGEVASGRSVGETTGGESVSTAVATGTTGGAVMLATGTVGDVAVPVAATCGLLASRRKRAAPPTTARASNPTLASPTRDPRRLVRLAGGCGSDATSDVSVHIASPAGA